jgi:flagellin
VTIGANTATSLSNNFTLIVDAGRSSGSLAVSVYVNAGTYATAASFQAELQADVSAALSGNNGFTGGVTVTVTDLGSGVWNVQWQRNSNADSTGITIEGYGDNLTAGTGFLASGSAAVANTGGGVFQVGANVTATNQIKVSIDDIRITSGSNSTYTSLAQIDVTNAANHQVDGALVDSAIAAVSSLRGKLGADQNRFQSTIANLQVTTENLSASESRIRDTDMAYEMVNFTRDQILLQAGTAMLAQANAAPQTVLRLLQG